jgi:hypothetical protein
MLVPASTGPVFGRSRQGGTAAVAADAVTPAVRLVRRILCR